MSNKINLKIKVLISVLLFCIVVAGLLTVASFFDLQISNILAKPFLSPNEYFSTNGFGLFFEAIGSAPIWIMISVAGVIWFWYFYRTAKKWLAPLFFVVVIVGFYFFISDIFNYVGEHIGNEHFMKKGYIVCLELTLTLIISALFTLQWGRIKAETNAKLRSFTFVILFTLALYLVINFVKSPVGRARYRAMNAIDDFNYYTPWYVLNGKRSLSSALPSDNCKSFPSGHTFSAGMVYTLLALPYLLESWNKKSVKLILWIACVGYTGVVAISRVIVGAHFMSDVTVGGTLSFSGAMIAREIFVCRGSNVKALFAKRNM